MPASDEESERIESLNAMQPWTGESEPPGNQAVAALEEQLLSHPTEGQTMERHLRVCL